MKIQDIVTTITAIIGCITGVSGLITGLIKNRKKPKIWFEDARFIKTAKPFLFQNPDNVVISKKSVAIAKLNITGGSDFDNENISCISEGESLVGILNYSDRDLSASDTFTKERPLFLIFTFKNIGLADAQNVAVRKVKIGFPKRTETLYPDKRLGASFGNPILLGQSTQLLFGYFFASIDKDEFLPADNYAQLIDKRAKVVSGNIFGTKMPDPIERYKKIVIHMKIKLTTGRRIRQRIVVKFVNGQYVRDTV